MTSPAYDWKDVRINNAENIYNTAKWNKFVSTGETMESLADHLPELLVFVKVVELKSFSEAARATGSTKSTVSKQVRRLEEALGAKLLNRTTRHLGLTEAGELAYQHGARIVEESSALRSSVDGLQASPRGHLRVSTSVAFGNLHLSRLIAQFLDAYPNISVSLTLSDRYVDLVDEGFDVAVRLTSKPIDTMVARRLATIDYVVCAAPAYLRTHPPIVVPDDLGRHNCMINGTSRDAVWRFVREGTQSEVRVTGRYTVNSSESLRAAVLEGAGIALLPTFAIADDLRLGRLETVLPTFSIEGTFGNSVYAVFLPNRFVAPKMRVFIDFLMAQFSGSGDWPTMSKSNAAAT
jgi:DNA-binding transcriptional LysR family regulator